MITPTAHYQESVAIFIQPAHPFNPTTRIEYLVPERGHVSLKICDLMGREVATLFEGIRHAGVHVATFDGIKNAGGVHFCSLTDGKTALSKKLILCK